MTKFEIRLSMRQRSLDITRSQREEMSNKILTEVESLPQFADSQTIALYASLPDEVSTLEYLDRWHMMGKRVLLPRVIDGERMEFYLYNKGELQSGAFGIEEPTAKDHFEASQIDLMLLPGVAFTRDGGRLGRGAGYYDRYLSRKGFRAYTVGLALPYQIIEQMPREEHDIALHLVLSVL